MKVELKNIKIATTLSEETLAFTATLYLDGKKAAEVSNRGCGGSNMYHFYDRSLEQPFFDFCKAQPKIKWEHGELDCNEDLYLDTFLTEHQNKAARNKYISGLKRILKTKVVFILKTDETGRYWQMVNQGNIPATVELIKKRYGDQVEAIVTTENDIPKVFKRIYGMEY